MTKAQPDARALRRPRAELVGPTTIAAMYGAAVYFDCRAIETLREHSGPVGLSRLLNPKVLGRI